jgi:hypothetical protein
MMALAVHYPMERCTAAAFSGDDSAVFFPREIMVYDKSPQIAASLNLSAKLELYKGSIYFCSKFVISVQGRIILAPDPIKAIAKLGRDDMYCLEHV